MKVYLFPVLIVFFSCISIHAQSEIDRTFEAASDLLPTNPDSATQLVNDLEAKVSQNKLGYYHREAAFFFKYAANSEKQIYHWQQLITSLKNDKDSSYYWYAYLNQAFIDNGEFQAAVENSQRLELHYQNQGDPRGLVAAYNGLGNTYYRFGESQKSIEYFLAALNISEELDDTLTALLTLGNLSNVYRSIGDLERSKEARQKALTKAKDFGDTTEIMFAQMNYGSILQEEGKYDSALYYLIPLIDYYSHPLDIRMLSAMYNKIGGVYSQMAEHDSAQVFYEKSLQLMEGSDHVLGLSTTLINYGKVLHGKQDYARGVQACRRALPLVQEIHYLELEASVCECLFANFKELGVFDSSLFYHEEMLRLTDSLTSVELRNSIVETELDAEYAAETHKIKTKANQEIEEVKVTRNALIIGVTILAMVLLFLFFAAKQRKKANLIIEKEKEYLDNLLHNLVHEFRTPLTLIKGPTEELLKVRNPQNQDFLDMINRNSNTMLSLVNQILDYAKLKAGKLPVRTETQNIQLFFDDLIKSYQNLLSVKNQRLTLNISSTFQLIEIDADKLRKIIDNLISNALKFSEEGTSIELDVEVEHDLLKIAVADQGVGLNKDNQERIFEKFYQVDSSTTRKGEGTGLGLTFVRELVHLMHGRIEVESQPGKGSIFSVYLPITTAKEQLANSTSNEVVNTPTRQVRNVDQSDKDLPLILVIEDNLDMQRYLSILLGDHQYRIELASNGQEGIEKTEELIPDIVISDVMMPLKDGYEVVQTLKNDPRTDHIPIIILTAKASFDSKLEGISTGADIYLSKPFSSEELILRVKNLLTLQLQIRKQYQEDTISPEGQIQKEEHPILIQIRNLIRENPDKKFSSDELAASVGFSRSQLHRKLKALTGMSSTAFVNEIRLNLALNDLKNSALNVSEISYKYGFSDPAYFSNLFKKRFGKTPSEVR